MNYSGARCCAPALLTVFIGAQPSHTLRVNTHNVRNGGQRLAAGLVRVGRIKPRSVAATRTRRRFGGAWKAFRDRIAGPDAPGWMCPFPDFRHGDLDAGAVGEAYPLRIARKRQNILLETGLGHASVGGAGGGVERAQSVDVTAAVVDGHGEGDLHGAARRPHGRGAAGGEREVVASLWNADPVDVLSTRLVPDRTCGAEQA